MVFLRPGTRANRAVRHSLGLAGRRLRHVAGRLQGTNYRLRGRHPNPDVNHNVLADRIRSSLGGVEQRLDVPRVHVMVQHHIALLHGAVGTENEADEVEKAVAAVSGVRGVESYLHIGLEGGDSRPSAAGWLRQPSKAHDRLIEAATSAGVAPAAARPVVRAILATFADRIPPGERAHVGAHLPADVRELFTSPRRTHRAGPPRTVHELVAQVASATSELPHDKAQQVVARVLQALRSLVPDEQTDVGAVLPPELRELWEQGVVGEPQRA